MQANVKLDCYGLLCPMPIIQIAKKIKEIKIGDVLEVIATDEGIKSDLPAWAATTDHGFLGIEQQGELYKGYIKKLKD